MRLVISVLAVGVLLGACGFPSVDNPVGEPLLPDLVPEPPVDIRLTTMEDGTVLARFSSTLVNVGDGDFVLRANRDEEGEWHVQQELWYSEGGGELIDTEATMAWGGDGHDHWHIRRVANYRLVPLDENGEPIEDGLFRVDSKIGFCFYDHTHSLDFGPEEYVFDVHHCGEEDETRIRMGLSPGWSDVYDFTLPGQSVDVTVVPDGMYRLYAEADADGWFTEATRDNNITWIDVELTVERGTRFAVVRDVGPTPESEVE